MDFDICSFCHLSKVIFFSLPSAKIADPDVTRLINSDEIQSVVRPAGQNTKETPLDPKRKILSSTRLFFSVSTPTPRPCALHEIRT